MPSSDEYRAALESAALFDLSDYGKVALTGRDSVDFLQNLCTQDVKGIAAGGGCEAFLTTNKARVIAHVWIGLQGAGVEARVFLDMVPGQAEKVLQHLNHFLISEKVELADLTSELGMLRIIGTASAEFFERLTQTAFATLRPLQHVSFPGIGFARRHSLLHLDGFDLFYPRAQTDALKQRLVEAGAAPTGAQTYDVLRVEAGLPQYGVDIDESRLAMETGRTTQAICYTKGCYLGQETIVMARDRGQVNRMLTGVKVAEGAPLASGTKLWRANEEVGQVTSCVASPRLGQAIGLAYLRRGSWDPGTELAIEPATAGRTAVVCSLPFFSGADATLP